MSNPFRSRFKPGNLVASTQAIQKLLSSAASLAEAPARSRPGKIDVAELLGRVLGRALPGGTGPQAKHTGHTASTETNFIAASYSGPAGTRPYRLFVPSRPGPKPALIVMLHGCTQSAEDFAAGTRMNELAEERGAFVLYPVQVTSANQQKCWNWFNPADQKRDGGEAALLAGMTRAVMADHHVDPTRVFVAGLSAGGAHAAILGATYPDLFSAVGVHSGLACGAASDMPGAFAAMRQGRPGQGRHAMRTIIFHGDADHTVNVRNADAVAEQVAVDTPMVTEQGRVAGGLAYTRTVQLDPVGRPALERWMVHGAGHAWSGGSSAGSFTEPRGPDASRAILDFFLAGS